MHFKKGDKVRFLNEAGEGIVTQLTANGMVFVEVDGFEIPYDPKYLVSTTPVKAVKVSEQEEEDRPVRQQEKQAFQNPFEQKVAEGIYLSFTPLNETNNAPLQVVLHNNTQYNMLFCCAAKNEKNYKTIEKGELFAFSNLHIGELLKSETEKWANLLVEGIYISNPKFEYLKGFSKTIKLKLVKFFKETSFAYHPLTAKNSVIEKVVEYDLFYREINPFNEEKLAEISELDAQKFLTEKENSISATKISKPNESAFTEVEIDLHIEELLDNFSNMSNSLIVSVQLNHARKALEDSMAQKINKIIFIHGVGNGKLKTEVRAMLAKYQGIKFYDAPFHKYGYGATEVDLKSTK
ncbi:MAG: DUF2027 domain-containing protein [Bacteroidota bacterium]